MGKSEGLRERFVIGIQITQRDFCVVFVSEARVPGCIAVVRFSCE